jgi:hypothetical protein
MKVRHLPIVAALGAVALPMPAPTQALTPSPLPASAASAAAPRKPAARLQSPAEKRDAASHDLRPEHPVVPQINIPLGRTAPAFKPPQRPETGARPADSAASAEAGRRQ